MTPVAKKANRLLGKVQFVDAAATVRRETKRRNIQQWPHTVYGVRRTHGERNILTVDSRLRRTATVCACSTHKGVLQVHTHR